MKMNSLTNCLIASVSSVFFGCGIQKPRATPPIDPQMQDQASLYAVKQQNAHVPLSFTQPARDIAQTSSSLEHKKDEHLPNAKRWFWINGQDSTLHALTVYRIRAVQHRDHDYLGKAKDLAGKPALLLLTEGLDFLEQAKAQKAAGKKKRPQNQPSVSAL